MKHYLNVRNAARACFVAAAVANATAQTAGTAFSDQGQLDQSGNPAAGKHDLVFRLFSVETGGVRSARTFALMTWTWSMAALR